MKQSLKQSPKIETIDCFNAEAIGIFRKLIVSPIVSKEMLIDKGKTGVYETMKQLIYTNM